MVARRGLLRGMGAAAAVAASVGIGADFNRPDQARDGATPVEKKVKARALILLDRSGSMSVVRQATLDGLNKFLDEQRDKPDLHITLLQFDTAAGYSGLDITETFIDIPAPKTPQLTLDDFVPRGGTPLRSALSDGVRRMEEIAKPDQKILVAVFTDGDDTTSPTEITIETVKTLVESKKSLGNWTFVFSGADIDAWGAASSIGVGFGNTMQFTNDYAGTVTAYSNMSASTNAWYGSQYMQSENFFDQNSAQAIDIDADMSSWTPPSTGTALTINRSQHVWVSKQ